MWYIYSWINYIPSATLLLFFLIFNISLRLEVFLFVNTISQLN